MNKSFCHFGQGLTASRFFSLLGSKRKTVKKKKWINPPTGKWVAGSGVTAAGRLWHNLMDAALLGQHSISPPAAAATNLIAFGLYPFCRKSECQPTTQAQANAQREPFQTALSRWSGGHDSFNLKKRTARKQYLIKTLVISLCGYVVQVFCQIS